MVVLHEMVSATPQKYSEDILVTHLSCMGEWCPPITITYVGIDFMDVQYPSDDDIPTVVRGLNQKVP
jgi:hypothetical protein